MKYTDKYKLKKPEPFENVLVEDLNENMDIVDTELSKIGNSQTEVMQQFTEHKTDMAKHNQFMLDGKLHQLGFGYNSTLGCFTWSIREVVTQ